MHTAQPAYTRAALRPLRRRQRGLPEAPLCAPTAGGSAATDDELRGQIRARLSEARLPAVDGGSRSSRGTGRPCVVCRRAIEPTEVERQVGGLGVFLYAHEACYKLWREESVVFRATKDRTKSP